MKHYLFFAQLSYSYSILRPLQQEIWRRGDDVAWYLEDSCPDLLVEGEKRLHTIDEVMDYKPIAVFAPGNYIYDFFPGVKVSVFHGYPLNKRNDKNDDHFKLRGWFDIYCTQGETSSKPFRLLEKKYGYFKVYETGWCKMDALFGDRCALKITNKKPTILYGTTFTKGISSAWIMHTLIRKLAVEKDWNWIITLHPKLHADANIISYYQNLAKDFPNVIFQKDSDWSLFKNSDVLLCDSSSLIIEYMMLDKPVVTFRNTHPDRYLINVEDMSEIGSAIETALTYPKELMKNIRAYTEEHEGHRDGLNSSRVLDAVDDFIENYQGRIKKKPLNLFRKLKLRWQLKYFKW